MASLALQRMIFWFFTHTRGVQKGRRKKILWTCNHYRCIVLSVEAPSFRTGMKKTPVVTKQRLKLAKLVAETSKAFMVQGMLYCACCMNLEVSKVRAAAVAESLRTWPPPASRRTRSDIVTGLIAL
jgi:hypothetical protein